MCFNHNKFIYLNIFYLWDLWIKILKKKTKKWSAIHPKKINESHWLNYVMRVSRMIRLHPLSLRINSLSSNGQGKASLPVRLWWDILKRYLAITIRSSEINGSSFLLLLMSQISWHLILWFVQHRIEPHAPWWFHPYKKKREKRLLILSLGFSIEFLFYIIIYFTHILFIQHKNVFLWK